MNCEVQVYSITDEYMKNNYVKTLPYELIENLIYFLYAYPILVMINHITNKNDKILKYKKNNIKVNNFFSTNEIKKEVLNKAFDDIEIACNLYGIM